jgi:hypothetical protein
MKSMVLWGLLMSCWRIQAQNLQQMPAACWLSASGLHAPLAQNTFAALSFPQGSIAVPGWKVGFNIQHYPDLPGFSVRQLGLIYPVKRLHLAFYAQQLGDELYREQNYQLQMGISAGRWWWGAGLSTERLVIERDGLIRFNAQLGASYQISKYTRLHTAMHHLRQPFHANNLLTPPPLQMKSMVLHQMDKLWLQAVYRREALRNSDVGLGLLYFFKQGSSTDLSWSSGFRRMAMGFRFGYHNLTIHLQLSFQQLPGIWWQSGIDWPEA